VAQGVTGPEFKPQYCKSNNNNNNFKILKESRVDCGSQKRFLEGTEFNLQSWMAERAVVCKYTYTCTHTVTENFLHTWHPGM
jgi:hypothetical protein